MNWGFMRSVFVASLCGLAVGVFELCNQGMPPFVQGFLPVLLYLFQFLSFYAAAGAGLGFASGLLMWLLFGLVGSGRLVRLLRDTLPVLVLLAAYFRFGGGHHSKISVWLDPPLAGFLPETGVYALVLIFAFAVVLIGYFAGIGPVMGGPVTSGPVTPGTAGGGRMRDLARGFSTLVVLAALFLGLSAAVRTPVGGSDTGASEWAAAENRPVLVFGIDGVHWDMVMPLIESGAMPNFKKVMERGVYGNIRTVGAALSSALWTDMATGKDRSKHSIIGNVIVPDGSYIAVPPRSYHRKVPAIWNILSDADRKVAVANWRVTYPPEEVNGVIASMLAFEEPGKVYPESLEAEILKIGKPLRTLKTPDERRMRSGSKTPPEVARDFEDDLIVEGNVFNYLTEVDRFDLYAYYSHATDAVQHIFWKFREPEKFRGGVWDETEPEWDLTEENIRAFHSFIDDIHIMADSVLGEVIDNIGGDPSIVIVSDHGQQPVNQPLVFVDLHVLLGILGLMSFDQDGNADFAASQVFPLFPMTMKNTSGLGLNLKGKESMGWIEPGPESDRIIEEAIRKLKSVRVVETGEPFFNVVRQLRENDFRGHYLKGRLEIMLKGNPQAYGADLHVEVGDSVFTMDQITEMRGISGKHTNMGVFVVSGPEFTTGALLPSSNSMTARVLRAMARGAGGRVKQFMNRGLLSFNLLEEVTILDLTPTLLYMFDLPVGRDMDGHVPVRLIECDVLRERGVDYVDSYDHLQIELDEPRDDTMSEEEMEQLRALGYIK